jgi:HK97 family phage prohead protease
MEHNQPNPTRKEREIRKMAEFQIRQAEQSDGQYVEGYALTFDTPTVLYELDGIEYKEMIDARALNASDMSDVIFNYNHSGKVMARTRNNTLELTLDERGLFVRAKLDGTEEGRKLYDEIRGGYIDRMSFSFVVSEQRYDKENRMRVITGIRKIYDVSAVDIPAYDTTSISARSFFEAAAEEERKALDSAAERRKLLLRTFTF